MLYRREFHKHGKEEEKLWWFIHWITIIWNIKMVNASARSIVIKMHKRRIFSFVMCPPNQTMLCMVFLFQNKLMTLRIRSEKEEEEKENLLPLPSTRKTMNKMPFVRDNCERKIQIIKLFIIQHENKRLYCYWLGALNLYDKLWLTKMNVLLRHGFDMHVCEIWGLQSKIKTIRCFITHSDTLWYGTLSVSSFKCVISQHKQTLYYAPHKFQAISIKSIWIPMKSHFFLRTMIMPKKRLGCGCGIFFHHFNRMSSQKCSRELNLQLNILDIAGNSREKKAFVHFSCESLKQKAVYISRRKYLFIVCWFISSHAKTKRHIRNYTWEIRSKHIPIACSIVFFICHNPTSVTRKQCHALTYPGGTF